MKTFLQRVLVCLGITLVASLAASANAGPVKVVYHINTGLEQATDGLRNANNHLAADPKAKIVFVTHANGVHFLLDGAKDKNGNTYDALVHDLVGKGVEFRACRFTLERQKIDPKRLIQDVTIVPSGVAEVSRLQSQEGFAYLKP